jgi:subtilisin family serine protease
MRSTYCFFIGAAILVGCRETHAPEVTAPRASITAPQSARYIVRLRRGLGDVPGRAQRLTSLHTGRLTKTWRRAIEGFAVELTPAAAKALANEPDVITVKPDQVIQGDALQNDPFNWGLDRIDERTLPMDARYVYFTSGSGVHVYVIDSGIRSTHGEFGGRVGNGRNFVNDGRGNTDCNGHGTHVASIVGGATSGVAKNVTLHSVRVLDCNNSGWVSDFIDAVEWVMDNAVSPAVANMSLSSATDDDLNDAVEELVESGVVVTASAGNQQARACTRSPASAPDALTVGATDSDDDRWTQSNYGTCLDLFAPGASISAATNANDFGRVTKSGTSMAAPHVAGAAAKLLQSNPNWTPAQVRASIILSASVDKVRGQGVGSPDLLLYSR